MRSAVAVLPLAVVLGACGTAPPTYENPRLVQKIDRQRIERDNCLLAHTPQLDDGRDDVRGIARAVAAACSVETDKLLVMTIPYADERARLGFQQEAVRRAADIVLSFRQVDGRAGRPSPGEPTPLR
jgi:hypothetical protein